MIKKILAGFLFLGASITAWSADFPDMSDYSMIAEECRQIALKLDYLSRYQERLTCVTNLDGASVYVASQYIFNYQLKDAKALISKAIILTKFAIDINCNGQEEMKEVVDRLQVVQKKIS